MPKKQKISQAEKNSLVQQKLKAMIEERELLGEAKSLIEEFDHRLPHYEGMERELYRFNPPLTSSEGTLNPRVLKRWRMMVAELKETSQKLRDVLHTAVQ